MKTPHPYAEILRAIADGEEIQFRSAGTWCDQSLETTLQEIADEDYPPECYRVKPNVVMINGHEVPEPLKELPLEDGAMVYWPWFGIGSNILVSSLDVGLSPCLLLEKLLALGLLHATEEAAAAHAAALVSFTKRD